MHKKNFPLFVLIVFCFLAATTCFAAGPPKPPPTPPCWPPPCTVPLDGGISLLIAAGVALGGKKIYDFKNKT